MQRKKANAISSPTYDSRSMPVASHAAGGLTAATSNIRPVIDSGCGIMNTVATANWPTATNAQDSKPSLEVKINDLYVSRKCYSFGPSGQRPVTVMDAV